MMLIMIEVFDGYLKMLEGAFFFIVPVVLVLSVGGTKEFRSHPGAKLFISLAVGMFGFFLIYMCGNKVSRYMFVPAVLISMLAGGFCGNWERLPARWRSWAGIMLLTIAVVSCLITSLRTARPYPKQFVFDFAQTIRGNTTDRTIILCGVSCSSVLPVGFVLHDQNPQVHNFDSVTEFVDFLPHQTGNVDLYLLLDIARDSSSEDFIQEFRSSYYIFPFELVDEAVYRRKRYLLYRYTGKTGDGNERGSRQWLLDSLPAEIKVDSAPGEINFADILPPGMISADDFIIGQTDGYLNSREMTLNCKFILNQLPKSATVYYHNELFWPEANREVILDTAAAEPEKLSPVPPTPAVPGPETAEDQPLVLDIPPAVVASDQRFFYLTGVVPGNGNNRRMSYFYHAPDGKKLPLPDGKFELPETAGRYRFEVKDRCLATTRKFAVELKTAAPFPADRQPPRILFLNDSITSSWGLEKTLNSYWQAENIVSALQVPCGLSELDNELREWQDFWSRQEVNQEYKLVVLNFFADPIILNRTFPFNNELFEAQFSAMLKTIQSHYPHARLVLAVPPPPAERVHFPGNLNGRMSRLSHYRLVKKLLDCVQNNSSIEVLPLVGSIDSYIDYAPYWRDHRQFATPYGLSDAGKKKIIAAILAWLNVAVDQVGQ